jgi:hypothetical protein
MSADISTCTQQDYNQIIEELRDFWDERDVRHLHHPMLINEFGNSAFVIRKGAKVCPSISSQTTPWTGTLCPLRRIRATARLRAYQGYYDAVQFGLDCLS